MSVPLRYHVCEPHPTLVNPLRKALVSAVIYILLCTLYIVLSSDLAARTAASPDELKIIETYKGVAFICVTGLMYFVVSLVRWSRIRRQEETILRQARMLLRTERKLLATMSGAIMAHDLNNLLMSLSGLVEGIKGHERHDVFLLELRREIEVITARLSRLSRRITTAVGRALPETPEAMALDTTLQDLLAVAQRHPDVHGCRLRAPDLPRLNLVLHRTLFEEAVLNLVINAAQATGPSGQIEVRLSHQPPDVLMEVHDNGPGVPDAVIDEIFEPCYTTKSEGSGIGLLAVRAFAASCNAEITVMRSPLGGALFRLRIPMPTDSGAG